jgi:hypothetical protein
MISCIEVSFDGVWLTGRGPGPNRPGRLQAPNPSFLESGRRARSANSAVDDGYQDRTRDPVALRSARRECVLLPAEGRTYLEALRQH